MNKSLFGTTASAQRQARARAPRRLRLGCSCFLAGCRIQHPRLYCRVGPELCLSPQTLQHGQNPNTAPLSLSQKQLSEVFPKLLLSPQFP